MSQLLYSALKKGSDHIEKFLSVDSLSIEDARMVSFLYLDILFVYKKENKYIPNYIQRCLDDYDRIFESGKNLLQHKMEIVDLSGSHTLYKVDGSDRKKVIDYRTIVRLIILGAQLNINLPHNKLIDQVIVSLSKCHFTESVSILFVIKHIITITNIKLIPCENNALVQAELHLKEICKIIESPQLSWELLMFNQSYGKC